MNEKKLRSIQIIAIVFMSALVLRQIVDILPIFYNTWGFTIWKGVALAAYACIIVGIYLNQKLLVAAGAALMLVNDVRCLIASLKVIKDYPFFASDNLLVCFGMVALIILCLAQHMPKATQALYKLWFVPAVFLVVGAIVSVVGYVQMIFSWSYLSQAKKMGMISRNLLFDFSWTIFFAVTILFVSLWVAKNLNGARHP